MIRVDPEERITAKDLQERFVNLDSWSDVRAGTATREFIVCTFVCMF